LGFKFQVSGFSPDCIDFKFMVYNLGYPAFAYSYGRQAVASCRLLVTPQL